MIEIHEGNPFKNFDNQVITQVRSIIITTSAGDIIITPSKGTEISLTTTETFGLLDCLSKKEVTIEAQYDNAIVIK